MEFLAGALLLIGWLAFLFGEVRLLAFAYKRNVGSFLACLLLPFFAWGYLLLHARAAARPVGLILGGLLLLWLGLLLGESVY